MAAFTNTAGAATTDEKEDDIMAKCKANLEAARQTLQKFDKLDKQWQVDINNNYDRGGR